MKKFGSSDPDILGGTTVFVGTRVPVAVLFENLADGLTLDQILESYPTIPRELALLALAGVGTYIADLAQRHGITSAGTSSDALADVITELAGDEIVSDETENLIVGLRRAHAIDGREMVELLGQYLDERQRRKGAP